MWIVLSAAVMLAACAGSYALVQAARPRSCGLAAVLSAAVLLSLEAALLHLLSPLGMVARRELLLGNAAIAAAGLLVYRNFRPERRLAPPLRFIARGMRLTWVVPLGLLAAVSAIEYLPNNWDSMTYHLARVAYWLQNRSVEPYPTNIPRQVAHPPGAEYLLLALQVMAHSDRLANLLQLAAWATMVFAAPPLVRSFGAPQRVAAWAGVLVGTLPLALLQASSAQNDIVATLMAVAIAVACLPFLHSRRHWRWPDLLLLAAAGAGGLLVKPTALLAAAPLIAWALIATGRSLRGRRDWTELGRGLGTAAALMAAAVGPALLACLSVPDFSGVSEGFVYSGVSQPVDRLTNALRGMARQIPLTDAITEWLAPPTTRGCSLPNRLCVGVMFRFQEDYAGNLGHAIFSMGGLLLGAVRWRSLPRRAQLALASLPAGWLLFHAIFRDNVWLTRLQLPLFGLGALVLVAFGARPGRKPLGEIALAPIMMLLTAYAALAVSRNQSRMPSVDPRDLAFAASPAAYYVFAPSGVEAAHAAALEALRASGCPRLGMYLGVDSYDYPLAWRAMQAGAEVRHVMAPDDWPCLVFSDRGTPPPRPSGGAWRALGPSVYLAAQAR